MSELNLNTLKKRCWVHSNAFFLEKKSMKLGVLRWFKRSLLIVREGLLSPDPAQTAAASSDIVRYNFSDSPSIPLVSLQKVSLRP